jgi:asparagine N-glycosylation enzyme membrane subunit Stt3
MDGPSGNGWVMSADPQVRAEQSWRWQTLLPVLDWGRRYDRETFSSDLVAAIIVTIMLIPQSLAYALLAGLPPEVGLYASMAPLVLYALLGTSRVLAVGPVAVAALSIGLRRSPWPSCLASFCCSWEFSDWVF